MALKARGYSEARPLQAFRDYRVFICAPDAKRGLFMNVTSAKGSPRRVGQVIYLTQHHYFYLGTRTDTGRAIPTKLRISLLAEGDLAARRNIESIQRGLTPEALGL